MKRVLLTALLAVMLGGCGTAAPQTGRGPVVGMDATGVGDGLGQPVPAAAPPTASSTPAARPTPNFCGIVTATYPPYSLEDLTWTAHQIVVGTVVERRAPAVAVATRPAGGPAGRAAHDQIYTEYVVRVDERLRGLPLDTILVQVPGGTVDGCTQNYPSDPSLVVGERRLLFLRGEATPSRPVPAYTVNAGEQGAWRLGADGTVATRSHPQYNGQPPAQLAAPIRAALAGPPPRLPQEFLVPLDQAPLPPTP